MAWHTIRRPDPAPDTDGDAEDILAAALAEIREAVERLQKTQHRAHRLRES
ncbi:hypothetical protein ACWDTT_33260 [Streptosporangium sandarakinum]